MKPEEWFFAYAHNHQRQSRITGPGQILPSEGNGNSFATTSSTYGDDYISFQLLVQRARTYRADAGGAVREHVRERAQISSQLF
jgi:hypothetical protein